MNKTNQDQADLIKRIKLLDKQMKDKKTLIEREVMSFENICNELMSLQTKLETMQGETTG